MQKSVLKVTLIQMNSGSDKAANLAAATSLVERAVEADRPDWIALPECFDFLGARRADKMAAAEELGAGPAYTAMRTLAAKHHVFIHAGSMLEKRPGSDRIGNTTVAFDRQGREVARYRKIHMFDIETPDGVKYHESAAFEPGEAVATYECEGVTVGCAICYDLRFPSLFAELARRGAALIALPSAFTLQTGKDHWEVLCRARAIETQAYVAAPAQVGTHKVGTAAGDDEVRTTYGHSLVADPWGLVIARAADGPGFTTAHVDPERVVATRRRMPVQAHARPIPTASR